MDIFSTGNLIRIVQSLEQPASYLLDTLFPNVQESETERIYFDVQNRKNRITPFVSPLVEGKIVNELGFETKDFAPPYAKDKRVFRPDGALKRAIGEKIGGTMSPAERQAARLRLALEDQLAMLTMREEVMASELLRTGKITVSGEGFATQVIDFGRDAGLTVTLLTNDRWSVTHADSNPQADLQAWATLVQSKSGAAIRGFIMDPDAWSAFRARIVERDEADMLFNWLRAGSSEAELGPFIRGQGNQKARVIGKIGDFFIAVYDEIYYDDDGNLQHVMPSGTVIGVTESFEGTRCYGVIQDEKAGLKAMRYFSKSWFSEDPALRWLLLQSAPLPAPFRPNASFSAQVL